MQSFNVSSSANIISWSNGNGEGRVVYINTTNTFSPPLSGSNPVANTNYTIGQQCVYNGTGNSVTVTGLNNGTIYWMRVYEYCSPDRIYNINTANNNPSSFLKCSPCNFTIVNKLYIEGNYLGGRNMIPVIDNINSPLLCDSITLSLVRAVQPFDILYSGKGILTTNGIGSVSFTNVPYGNYYLLMNHRNSIPVWSKTIVTINNSTIYYNWTSSFNPMHAFGNGSSITEAGHTCKTIKQEYPSSASGFYYLDPDDGGSNVPIQCYCDMTTEGGGWTLVAQHTFPSVAIAGQNYPTYAVATGTSILKTGTGAPQNGELWIGLTHWANMGSELLLQTFSPETGSRACRYTQFGLDPNDKFRLSISGFTEISGVGDNLSYHNGYQFSTFDNDNDDFNGGSCAINYSGMGWHGACHLFKLFGDGCGTCYATYGPSLYALWGQYNLNNSPRYAGLWLR